MVLNSASPWTDEQVAEFWQWKFSAVNEFLDFVEFQHISGQTEMALEHLKSMLRSEKGVSETLRRQYNEARDQVKEAERERFQPNAPPLQPINWMILASEEVHGFEATLAQMSVLHFNGLFIRARSAIHEILQDQQMFVAEFNVLHHRREGLNEI